MKIAILGYGLQGQSVYEYCKQSDSEITVCDRNSIDNLPGDVETRFGEDYLKDLDQFDLIYRSPGVHPYELVLNNNQSILSKVTTNTNEFFKLCPTDNIIGITGTKGKGTTSSLSAKILEAYGNRVHLGGNIGVPPLDLLKGNINKDDWVVLELANFQLIDLKYSPKIAVCLLVEPEHLDWHKDTNEYIEAKSQLFKYQKEADLAIYYAGSDFSKQIASNSKGKLIPYFKPPGAYVDNDQIVIDDQPIIKVNEIKLPGKHNWQNVCAAVTVCWQIKKDAETIAKVIREFAGLPFRLELVNKVNEVSYFNDSFASMPSATIAAIEAVTGSKVLIIGGKDRGLNLDDLINTLREHSKELKKILVIGEASERISSEFRKNGITNFEVLPSEINMGQIVKMASELAETGESIVLSPGFPSFDMFKNFEDRGQKFNRAVDSL